MTTPELRAGALLAPELHEQLVQRSALECFKWNLAAGDRPTTACFPIVISRRLFAELSGLAEALDAEAELAERELLARPELQAMLGLPAHTAACIADTPGAPRYTRFDFHPTRDGFCITESNCDVAGGLLEASGVGGVFASLLGRALPEDPAGAYVHALARRFGARATIGVMHLSNHSEDRQVALYLARRLREEGLVPVLLHPADLPPGLRGLDALYRFVPGDWLEQLGDVAPWRELFASPKVSNPLSTLLVQSKRFSLVWPELDAPLTTWKRLLPETREPSRADDGWVLKPAFGNEGANVVIVGLTDADAAAELHRRAAAEPRAWVQQQRFEHALLDTPEGPRYVVVGVFVVDGRACGSYARLSAAPLIDDCSQEAVVLVEPS